MNKKNKGDYFLRLFGGVFFLVGLGVFIGGILLYSNMYKKIKNGDRVIATITDYSTYRDSDGDTHRNYYVDYTYNGEKYEGVSLGYSSNSLHMGSQIVIYVNPEKPLDIAVPAAARLVLWIMVPVGLVFAVSGFLIAFFDIRKDAKRKKLLTIGRRIPCEVVNVKYSNVSVNHVVGRVIVCKDPYTGNVYSSNRIYDCIESWLAPGTPVNVYVDPNNPKYYYVEEPTQVSQTTYY